MRCGALRCAWGDLKEPHFCKLVSAVLVASGNGFRAAALRWAPERCRVSLKAAEGPYVSQFRLSISGVLRRLPDTEVSTV